MGHRIKYIGLILVAFLIVLPVNRALGSGLTLMVLDNNSYLAGLARTDLNWQGRCEVVTASELQAGGEELRLRIDHSEVILVDVMGRDLETYLVDNINLKDKVVYGLRGSVDDEGLAQKGIIFDPDVADYYRFISQANITNMLRMVVNRHFDPALDFAPVQKKPRVGLYHPDHNGLFTDRARFQKWQETRIGFDPAHPIIAILFFASSLSKGQKKPIDSLIYRLEAEGYTVLPCFGADLQTIDRFLVDDKGQPQVDVVLAFSLKFYSALSPELAAALRRLNRPVINLINLYSQRLDEWRASGVGIGGNEVTWSIATPEISGLIEPTPLSAKVAVVDSESGKVSFRTEPIAETMDLLMGRLAKLVRLQTLANKEKRVAIMYYNHQQGKQNIGASYLNIFSSLEEIISAMAGAGYQVPLKSEADLKKMILTSGRNIGSWAPGELDRLLESSQVVRLPVATYKKWFAALPQDFQDRVIEQWGTVEASTIMRDGDSFIIPAVLLDHILLLPEPARGWGDDPMKLYHDTTLYPHHQYLAVYLWLNHGFKADAMIHLGTHSTYEWTPGKQAGLSPSCAPEVLLGAIPNIYPYIVDDVGEGIQAKRRGRGVVISHLTPMLAESGLYAEYSRMAELISGYKQARARQSDTASGKYQEIMALAEQTGIFKDIEASFDQEHLSSYGVEGEEDSHKPGDTADKRLHLLGHYLDEIKTNLVPHGMHRFGHSPQEDAIRAMADAVAEWNPGMEQGEILRRVQESAGAEMTALLTGLAGGYVAPGVGNDPIREPAALPTGRNFYGFNPDRVPSKAAWKLGQEAADKIIKTYLGHHGRYPNKVAVVLWATETMRNEGVNESTILSLMGIRPKWLKNGRVRGMEVIPASLLGRPRIDVMVTASGLYRDQFPDRMQYIDRAIELAIRQTDITNLLRSNSVRLKIRLQNRGMAEEEAEALSRLRIFSEESGSYGTGVGQMASGSGVWQKEQEVVDVFENRMGFVFGGGNWGTPARQLLKDNLATVDIAVHSRSSNVYGLLDNDDVFQYIGGLSMAVRLESGKTPETLITRQQKPGRLTVDDLGVALGREIRSRYLNPKWIKAMQAEDYAGAREMAHFVEYLWGWNMTNPEKISGELWQETYEVYVEDKYGQELKSFFDSASPWAGQSITGRMLETIRKGYWQADESVRRTLAVEYAVSVVERGVACCDHTCNNPLLHQMVVSIISLPGVMSPEMVSQFKIAVEQAAGRSLDEQVAKRKAVQQELVSGGQQRAKTGDSATEQSDGATAETEVEGYKMEKIKSRDETTEVTSSGVEWFAALVVLMIIGILAYGMRRGQA